MIILLSDDLLDASKTTGHARAAGFSIVQCKKLAEITIHMEMGTVECCIIDLNCQGLKLDSLMGTLSRQQPRPRVIGYGSHVDGARLAEAKKAGCEEVMARSKYFKEMPTRIGEWAKVGTDQNN
ncbi:MAG: hypothetical protein K8T89_13005 [Planctomycetes bacterium]|nr:hypothetical protein [Planctomycetota bacterium]